MLNSNETFAYRQAGEKLTTHAKNSLIKAGGIARQFGCEKISPAHLLFAIYLEKGCLGRNILKDLGLTRKIFSEILKENFPTTKAGVENPPLLGEELKKIFIKAYSVAKEFNYPYVGTEHLIYALLDADDTTIKKIISRSKIKNVKKSMRSLFDPGQLSDISKIFNLPEIKIGRKSSQKSSATPFIDKFCANINEEARKKDEIMVGRKKEIERMINILGRKNKNNPLLIGDPGVGKTALVSGLAQLINSSAVPPSLYKKRIMSLDVAQLVAGTSFRGEFESRLKEIIKEARENKETILFIDEIHNIIGAGNVPGGLDMANVLKPALSRGEIQIIGATTVREYKKHIEKDAALERRFQSVHLQEPSREETEKILFGIKKNYEAFHNVSISDEAIVLAVELSIRYIQNRFLPDKAIDVIDETASNIRSKHKISDFLKQLKELEEKKQELFQRKEKLVSEENYEEAIRLKSFEKELEEQIKIFKKNQAEAEKEFRVLITPADIIETIAKISAIPVEKLALAKSRKIKNIKKILSSRVIGQEEVIEKLTGVLLRSQAGVSHPDRPLGSFLFLGPTGVGKTLTAKVLAQEFFDNPKSLTRIDMSELMERHSVSSLIGSPAGYIGYGEGGNLTEKIRRNPYSVVLFDEIEKAHPDVFNILLQILEDGTLTDAEGTAASFKNAIIILTSNIGTDEFTQASKIGFESEKSQKEISEKFKAIKDQAIKELEKRIKPELLSRMDHILVFNSLAPKDIQKISANELEKLKIRLKKQKIDLILSKEAVDFIARKSLAFNQGARLVRKNIQEMIENPIAEMIVYGRVRDGKISVIVKEKEIKLISI